MCKHLRIYNNTLPASLYTLYITDTHFLFAREKKKTKLLLYILCKYIDSSIICMYSILQKKVHHILTLGFGYIYNYIRICMLYEKCFARCFAGKWETFISTNKSSVLLNTTEYIRYRKLFVNENNCNAIMLVFRLELIFIYP